MKLKKSFAYGILALILIVGAGFLFVGGESSERRESFTGVAEEGGVQKVVIGMRNYNYYPQEIRVKAGMPVEIYLGDEVVGCFRDFTIPEFGVREYLRTSEDKITFTPTEKGTYVFACSMNMGSGRLVVE